MTNFYDRGHRDLQDEFESRALADRLEAFVVKDEIGEDDRQFIEKMDFFFLSTINEGGFPTTSYKGGSPGLVKVLDNKTLLFPCYDGNGMWLSAGNIDARHNVGLLFIDFEGLGRLRLEGLATLRRDAAALSNWYEVAIAIQVKVTRVWPNCPRYIHPMTRTENAEHVPREGIDTPAPNWKSMDAFSDVMPPLPHTLKQKGKSKD
jgi:hypothetical protein